MPSARIVEAVDVLEDGQLGVSARLPRSSPYQLRLDRFEGRLYGGVIIAIALTAHRYLEPMLAQELQVVV